MAFVEPAGHQKPGKHAPEHAAVARPGDAPNTPAGQGVGAPLRAAQKAPTGHCTGCELPAMQKDEAGHAVQSDAAPRPALAPYEPAGHGRPCASAVPAGQKRPRGHGPAHAAVCRPAVLLPTTPAGHSEGAEAPAGEKLPGYYPLGQAPVPIW